MSVQPEEIDRRWEAVPVRAGLIPVPDEPVAELPPAAEPLLSPAAEPLLSPAAGPSLSPAAGPSLGAGPSPAAVPLMNIANILTMLRIAIVPLFVLALFAGDGDDTSWRLIAAALFGIAAITDRFDGQLARKYGLVTDFGKLADPIADKALIGSALIGLSVLGDLAWWITLVICGREIGITVLRLAVVRRGVIPAGRGGKVKTLLQSVAIAVLLLPLAGSFATAGVVLMYLALLLTVVTGLDYVGQAARVWFAGSRAHGL